MAHLNRSATTRHKQWHQRRLNCKRIFSSSLGAILGIGTIAYLTAVTGKNFLMAPLGATCFIAFVIPDSAFAKPGSIIGGHLFASMIGLIFSSVWGSTWWASALAVGAVIAGMQVLRVLHPPAASDPLLIMADGAATMDILITPVLSGSIMIALIAMLFNNIVLKHKYFRFILHTVANVSSNVFFHSQQFLFNSKTTCIADQFAVGTNHAVAGDKDR